MIQVVVENQLPFPIYVFSVASTEDDRVAVPKATDGGDAANADEGPTADNVIKPSATRTFDYTAGSVVRAKSLLSGGHVSDKPSAAKVDFSAADLTAPNAIGTFPVPNSAAGILLPVDSQRRVVGVGKWQLGNNSTVVVVREQCWRRCADSYVLAPGEARTMGVTSLTGIERTSSTESTLSTALGASVSGGWGFISASLSASLSTSSRTSQSVTITEQQSQFDSVSLKNETDKVAVWLRWRLVDIVLLAPLPGYVVKATVETSQAPFLLGGPYDLS